MLRVSDAQGPSGEKEAELKLGQGESAGILSRLVSGYKVGESGGSGVPGKQEGRP